MILVMKFCCQGAFKTKLRLIKKITQRAVIKIVFKRIFIVLDVSYASQHTFSKVIVTILEKCYIS